MDENSIKREISKAKKVNYIALIILGIMAIIILSLFLRIFIIRDKNDSITVESAFYSVKNSESVLCKVNDIYYETDVTDKFVKLFQTDLWNDIKAISDKDITWITIHLAELYEIYIYSDGSATIYNGYSDTFQKDEAYYTIPSEVFEDVIWYILAKGKIVTAEDGVNENTFAK